MADIFEEVDEDLRRDTAAKLWAKYQNLVYGAVTLIIVGTAGVTGWQIYERNTREKAGIEYLATLDRVTKDPKAGQELLGQLIHADGPFANLARFDLVNATLKDGDKAKALELLTGMANDAGYAAPLKGAAAIMGGYVALDLGKSAEAAALAQTQAGDNQPYRFLAAEITGLAAFAAGDKAKAKEIFEKLDADLKKAEAAGLGQAPANLGERITIMLDRLNA
ncbi:tetratricopeptide repeat protein [Dongia sp.]|uniref:tetratricopeptide repeat protein n=1 Tax=Dongia sp. TaxID=1977262 RepID=UPI0035B17FEC